MGSATSATCQLFAAFRAAGLNAQYDIGPTGRPLRFQLVLPPYFDRSGMEAVLVVRVVPDESKHGNAILLSVRRWNGHPGVSYAYRIGLRRKASGRGIELTVKDALTRIQQDLGPTGFFLYLASQAA